MKIIKLSNDKDPYTGKAKGYGYGIGDGIGDGDGNGYGNGANYGFSDGVGGLKTIDQLIVDDELVAILIS